MDLSTIVTPGLQNLVTMMLGETWSAARDALARRLGRGDAESTRKAEVELDSVRTEVRALAGDGQGASDVGAEIDRRVLEAYVAGYLRRVREENPEVDEALAVLPTANQASDQSTVSTGGGMTQVFHGKVGSVFSVERLDGGLTVNNS
jgi:hypothetical protein